MADAGLQEGLARARKFIQYLAEIYWPYTNYQAEFPLRSCLLPPHVLSIRFARKASLESWV